jgi:Bacterial Ig-like domain (group 1).
MTRLMKWQRVIVGLFVASGVGCKDQSPTGPPAITSSPVVTALTPVVMNGTAGGVAATSPTIRITDGKTGAPLANVPVLFLLHAPMALGNYDGSVAHDSVVTDANGVASAGEWKFDTYAGTTEVVAWVYGNARVTFSATLKPDVPATLVANPPPDSIGLSGFKIDVVVSVADRFRNPIPHLDVAFKVIEGGGSIGSVHALTNEGGEVGTSWTLSAVGTNTVTATIAGLEPTIFRLRVIDPATLRWYKLDSWANNAGSLADAGISDARIGFGPISDCDCLSPQGFFIRTLNFTDGESENQTGTYKLEGDSISSKYWYSGSADKDVVKLLAPDPWDGEFYLTWIYRRVPGDE